MKRRGIIKKRNPSLFYLQLIVMFNCTYEMALIKSRQYYEITNIKYHFVEYECNRIMTFGILLCVTQVEFYLKTIYHF